MEYGLGFTFFVIALVIGIRLMAGRLDRARIEEYVRERGGTVHRITWTPLGKGWFGEENARIYRVDYKDAEGVEHRSTCKTRALGGVYWTGEPPHDPKA